MMEGGKVRERQAEFSYIFNPSLTTELPIFKTLASSLSTGAAVVQTASNHWSTVQCPTNEGRRFYDCNTHDECFQTVQSV